MKTILQGRSICMDFGNLHAVNQFDFELHNGELLGFLGPNGSGKSTLIDIITGFYKPITGKVFFKGQDITNLKVHQVARLGIARTFQNLRIFSSMTALENVMCGFHMKSNYRIIDSIFWTSKFRRTEKGTREEALKLLDFTGLSSSADMLAKNLPYGQQKRLEFARVLALDPTVCILDEPLAGLNDDESLQLMNLIERTCREKQISVILIEHNVDLLMHFSDRVIMMNAGKKIADGTPFEIQHNPNVLAIYLGGDEDDSPIA